MGNSCSSISQVSDGAHLVPHCPQCAVGLRMHGDLHLNHAMLLNWCVASRTKLQCRNAQKRQRHRQRTHTATSAVIAVFFSLFTCFSCYCSLLRPYMSPRSRSTSGRGRARIVRNQNLAYEWLGVEDNCPLREIVAKSLLLHWM